MTKTRPGRTGLIYYLAVPAIGVLIHQDFAAAVLGEGLIDWLRRNSEAFVLVFLVPLYWDFVANATGTYETRGDRGAVVAGSAKRPIARHLVWYGTLLIALALLEGPLVESIFSARLPQSIITVREGWVAAFILSLYFDWSRGRWSVLRGKQPSLRMVSARWRVAFFAAVAVFTVVIYQRFMSSVLGADLISSLQLHAETYASVLVIPVYFDVILPLCGGDALRALPARHKEPRSKWILATWYVTLGFLLLMATTSGAQMLVGASLGTWWSKVSETFLGAIGITFYFEVIRREWAD